MKVIKSNGEEYELSEKPDLKKMQEIVGGLIEYAYFQQEKDGFVALIANEEGLLIQLPYNAKASAYYGNTIVGDVILLTQEELDEDR